MNINLLKLIAVIIGFFLLLAGVYYGIAFLFSLISANPAAVLAFYLIGVAIFSMAGLFIYAHFSN